MITLERASLDDAAMFVEMEADEGVRDFIIPYTQAEHSRNLSNPQLIYLRILSGEKPVGFMILNLDADGNSVEFRRIVVATRGKGIGQSAITLMEEFCRNELARARTWLDVFEHNARGQHIYEKLGYVRRGESTHGEKALLIYEKHLQEI